MEEVSLGRLPEGCVSHVLSLTSPADTCRSAIVSTTFRSAAESDAVWEKFLPSDYNDIVSRASAEDEDSIIWNVDPKKQLFLRLCQRPLLIDDGKLSFMLDKPTGKKCYMVSARELTIAWGDTSTYWTWIWLPESRFEEVAELLFVWWFDINVSLDTNQLTPSTTYAAYLVFMLTPNTHGFDSPLPKASLSLGDNELLLDESVSLLSERSMSSTNVGEAKQFPVSRGDGWMELLLGEFSLDESGDDGSVWVRLREIDSGNWKSGLIVEGIEFRPINKILSACV